MPRGFPYPPEIAARAREMYATGEYTYRSIAEELGVASLKTIANWVDDPDGSKKRARIDSYAGTCEKCRKPTSGCDGPGSAPPLCARCRHKVEHEAAKARTIDMIQAWAEEHGGIPPTAVDWNPAMARRYGHIERAQIAAEGGWPCVTAAQHLFGSWNAAIEAAGFEPSPQGHYGRPGEDPELCMEIRERYEAGESTLVLGRAYGVAPGTIKLRLRKAGGRMRSHREAAVSRMAA